MDVTILILGRLKLILWFTSAPLYLFLEFPEKKQTIFLFSNFFGLSFTKVFWLLLVTPQKYLFAVHGDNRSISKPRWCPVLYTFVIP